MGAPQLARPVIKAYFTPIHRSLHAVGEDGENNPDGADEEGDPDASGVLHASGNGCRIKAVVAGAKMIG